MCSLVEATCGEDEVGVCGGSMLQSMSKSSESQGLEMD